MARLANNPGAYAMRAACFRTCGARSVRRPQMKDRVKVLARLVQGMPDFHSNRAVVRPKPFDSTEQTLANIALDLKSCEHDAGALEGVAQALSAQDPPQMPWVDGLRIALLNLPRLGGGELDPISSTFQEKQCGWPAPIMSPLVRAIGCDRARARTPWR